MLKKQASVSQKLSSNNLRKTIYLNPKGGKAWGELMGGPSKDPGGGLQDTRTISKSNLKISNHNKTPNKPCSNVCKKTTSDFSQEIEKIFQNLRTKGVFHQIYVEGILEIHYALLPLTTSFNISINLTVARSTQKSCFTSL